MKRCALLLVCLAVLGTSTGCCCLFPWCSGGYGACGYQQPCSPCSPYGAPYGTPYGTPYGGAVAPTSAYYPGATFQAGLSFGPAFAAGPYPVMATAPLEILPTY